MSKHLESLYQNLLTGKLPHNLSWSEAVELVEHLGEVEPHGDDEFVFRVGSQRVFFKRPHTHDLGVEEVSRLRKFLKEARPGAHVEEPPEPRRMIVVQCSSEIRAWISLEHLTFTYPSGEGDCCDFFVLTARASIGHIGKGAFNYLGLTDNGLVAFGKKDDC